MYLGYEGSNPFGSTGMRSEPLPSGLLPEQVGEQGGSMKWGNRVNARTEVRAQTAQRPVPRDLASGCGFESHRQSIVQCAQWESGSRVLRGRAVVAR